MAACLPPALQAIKCQDVGTWFEMDDSILNSKEAALMLDMSPDTVNEYARKAILPAFKQGRQWRFSVKDIEAFKRDLQEAAA